MNAPAAAPETPAPKMRLIAWLLCAGLVVLGSWMVVTPRIETATLAEVRAHAAPELLLPLPHPEGGIQRNEAARLALHDLFTELRLGRPRLSARNVTPLDLQAPQVRRVIGILEAGPLDRSAETETEDNRPSFTAFARGLTAAALAAADQNDWHRVRVQMDAAYLVLDRLTASDVRLDHPYYTMAVETAVHNAVRDLAARRDLPAALAEHWSALQAVDRHSQEQVRQVLRGEFQLQKLKEIPGFLVGDHSNVRPWMGAGSYDPIETTTLVSDRFVEVGRNAGLPVSRWSNAALDRIMTLSNSMQPGSGSVWSLLVDGVTRRARMNNAPNTQGRQLASFGYTKRMMDRLLEARSRREQVAAALAVARFRQRKGREPRSFDELIEAGLLQVAPMDHAKERPQAFDVQALFALPAPARQTTTGMY